MYWRYVRVRLAQEFGWDFAYIDGLSQRDINNVFAVMAAQERLKSEAAERARRRR